MFLGSEINLAHDDVFPSAVYSVAKLSFPVDTSTVLNLTVPPPSTPTVSPVANQILFLSADYPHNLVLFVEFYVYN